MTGNAKVPETEGSTFIQEYLGFLVLLPWFIINGIFISLKTFFF